MRNQWNSFVASRSSDLNYPENLKNQDTGRTRMPLSATQRVRSHDREVTCLSLVREGMTYGQVAQEVGYSHRSSARKAVVRALIQSSAESVQEHRELELDRLDSLQSSIWGQAMGGDLSAIQLILKIMNQRAVLLGLFHEKGKSSGDSFFSIVRNVPASGAY